MRNCGFVEAQAIKRASLDLHCGECVIKRSMTAKRVCLVLEQQQKALCQKPHFPLFSMGTVQDPLQGAWPGFSHSSLSKAPSKIDMMLVWGQSRLDCSSSFILSSVSSSIGKWMSLSGQLVDTVVMREGVHCSALVPPISLILASVERFPSETLQ